MAINTPSCYPQSQWGGGIDYDHNDAEQDNYAKPGSTHFQNHADTWLKQERGM